jgi:hypothetical protein
MTDDDRPENLVLSHLPAIRADVGEIKLVMREHATRLSALETTVAGLRLSIDRLDGDVQQIKKRLDLVEV